MRYTLFAMSPDGNRVSQIKGDPAYLDQQQRDLEALGYTVTVLDDDERIQYGQMAARLRESLERAAEDEA